MRVGSLFTGCGGLDLGLHAAGFETVWACEADTACRNILAARLLGLPVYPDVHDIDGTEPPVDVIAGGFPCQDLSYAGAGKGLDGGDRSILWYEMARAIRLHRPRHVIVENVPGLLTRGLGRVLYDLAEAGYVGSWCSLRASGVGAPHRRERVFVLATLAPDAGRERGAGHGEARDVASASGASTAETHERQRLRHASGDGGQAAPDTGRMAGTEAGERDRGPGAGGEPGARWDQGEAERRVCRMRSRPSADGQSRVDGRDSPRRGAEPARTGGAPADTDNVGREGQLQGQRQGRATGEPQGHRQALAAVAWGVYEPAIRRWERTLGRPAPAPVDDRGRLNPAFVEWMLGFPDGWTDGESRTQRLKMLGNSVQVQVGTQAGLMLRQMVEA